MLSSQKAYVQWLITIIKGGKNDHNCLDLFWPSF